MIEGCPWLTSVVFEKGAFRGGGCVTVASNPRLASLVFEEETFLTGGELNVTNNRELSELTFGTHAFTASSSLLLQENTKLRTVFLETPRFATRRPAFLCSTSSSSRFTSARRVSILREQPPSKVRLVIVGDG